MAVGTLESFTALADHHVPNMELTHQRALLLRAAGKSELESWGIEFVSKTTFKNRLSIASSEVALGLPDGGPLSSDGRGYWVGCHLKCCLAAALRSLMEAVS
jgi:hypothetical protein